MDRAWIEDLGPSGAGASPNGHHLLDRLAGHPQLAGYVSPGPAVVEKVLHQFAAPSRESPGLTGMLNGLCAHVLDFFKYRFVLR